MSAMPLRGTAAEQKAGAPAQLLEVANVTMRFGGIVALESVTFSVASPG
jgi:ABC-type uncharacterized transport system ATPase subunit